MEALAQLSKEIFYTLVMTMPRIVGAMTALTFMSPNLLGGRFPRNGIAAAFSLTAYPVVSEQIEQAYLPTLLFAAAAIKELLLGMLIGSVVMVVFWGIQAVGHFIDNQRGATMASTLDPFVGEQASPLALFMMQSLVAVFFCTGLFLGFLKGIYMSYVAWPATSFWPTMDRQVVDFLVAQFALISGVAVLVGGPVVIAMFFAELGLGFISRFAPQLNVFFLSMGVKSAVAALVLVLFWTTLIIYFGDRLGGIDVPELLELLYL